MSAPVAACRTWTGPGLDCEKIVRLKPNSLLANATLTALTLVLLLLVGSVAVPVAAQDPEAAPARFDRDAFLARARAQARGVSAGWTGVVSGDFGRSLEGNASLKFFETGGGRLKIAFYLGDTHAYYDGITIGGLISCGTGSRTYPVWVRRRAYEQQPPGRLEVYFTESQAIASKRAGVTPTPREDMYTPESGTVSLQLEEDFLEVRLQAVMSSGPLSPQASRPARILLQAHARVERTLDNDAEFATSLCDAPPPFEMVKILPEDGRDNVLLKSPEILLEFNQDIHPDSLENPDLVVVRTKLKAATLRQPWVDALPQELQERLLKQPWEFPAQVAGSAPPGHAVELDWTPEHMVPAMEDDDPDGERVPGKIELDGPRTLRFVPSNPLRSGVRYQVDVAHGPDGVRSTQFHVLDEMPPNFFSTRVEPDAVRMHVYQTTRDAPLLLRKPAVARVFVDWEADPDVHSDWQVRSYEVDLEITRDGHEGVVFPQQTHTVLRPDQYDDHDRRMAEDSINRFGWSPRARDITQLVARVTPHDPWPGEGRRKPPEDRGERTVEFASSQIDELSVEAYVVHIWKWLGQPPDAGTIANVISGFRRDNEFARQLFPVVRVRGRYAGVFLPPEDLRRSSTGLAVQARILHDHVGLQSGADIVVGYYPPNMAEGRGQGIASYPAQRANVVLMPVRAADGQEHPAILDMPLVAHEYGHVFGLAHNPKSDTRAERKTHCGTLAAYTASSGGIEGFRIAAGGGRGWSKSSSTGNAEDPHTLKDLMYPCVHDRRDWWWISDRDYKRLVDKLPGLLNGQRVQRYLRHHGRRPPDVSSSVLFDRSGAAPAGGRRRMLVSGTIEGDRVRFMPTVDLPEAGPLPEPGGDLTVVVEAANGALLATRDAVVVRDEDGDAFAYFSAVVDVEGEPARIALKRGRQELGDVAARVPPAPPTITSHADGARLAHGDWLRWEPVDVEGARYSVRYRPDPEASPRVLAALVDATAVPIDLAVLPAGASPTLEVVAHSGMHEARTLLRVQVVQDTRPMLVFPVDDAAPVHDEGIGAWFNSTLEADSVGADAIRLFDAQGRAIPVDARLLPSGDGVHGVPREPLAVGERYTVHLGAGLRHEDGRVMENPVRWSFHAGGARVTDARDSPKQVK